MRSLRIERYGCNPGRTKSLNTKNSFLSLAVNHQNILVQSGPMAHVYIVCSTQGIDQLEIPSLSDVYVRILVNILKILWLYMVGFMKELEVRLPLGRN